MTGIQIRETTDINIAAQQLISKGVNNVITTVGQKGTAIFEGKTNTNVIIPAWEVQAVDTTAAGDCFIGALAVGLSEGKSIINAAMFANAAAEISVTRVGKQPSLPYYGEVVQFLEKGNN